MNLLFCVFLSVGNSLLTLGLRQAGSKFFFFSEIYVLLRWFEYVGGLGLETGMNICIISVWIKYGRVGSQSLFAPIQTFPVVSNSFEFGNI